MGTFTKLGLPPPSSTCTSSSSNRKLLTIRIVLFFLIFIPLLLLNAVIPHSQLIDVLLFQTQSKALFSSPDKAKPPRWLEVIGGTHLNPKGPVRVGLINFEDSVQSHLQLGGIAESVTIKFKPVSPNVTWKMIAPGWINEMNPNGRCPDIPMPKAGKYLGLDVVVAHLPCQNDRDQKEDDDDDDDDEYSHWKEGIRDVRRLQISLAAARIIVENHGSSNKDKDVYVVFITKCEPMIEIFRCEDLTWHRGEYWVYNPNVEKLKEMISMPVGSCALAQPYTGAAAGSSRQLQGKVEQFPEDIQLTSSSSTYKPREAYVTVLHSSEYYVCGAIALAQSILKTNTTKDLVLLADRTLSKHSRQGLEAAGWKVKRIDRIRSPNSQVDAYNEWNYSKLRVWQLTSYDKVMFIDSDFIVLHNIDHFFKYPQLSGAPNNNWFFNSGIMILEPSECFFDNLMSKRYTLRSYNGGDQGYLNEVITWWHRLTVKLNFMKYFPKEFGDGPRVIPEDQHTIHFLGMKPWSCYRDYDCNWHRVEYHNFASDEVNAKWWQVYDEMPKMLQSYCGMTEIADTKLRELKANAEEAQLEDGHWSIELKDPRQYNLVKSI